MADLLVSLRHPEPITGGGGRLRRLMGQQCQHTLFYQVNASQYARSLPYF